MSQINETAIKTPGVYVNEIPSFPPSVAQVATAIPAFIGYTEKASNQGNSLLNIPQKVKSLAEFTSMFGGAYEIVAGDVIINVDPLNNYAVNSISYPQNRYIMFDAVRQFYDNGGGVCYIVSVGSYITGITFAKLSDGVQAIAKYDEPTLILFPDAVSLSSATDLYTLQQKALDQCEQLQDRFCVFDLAENLSSWDTAVQAFRDHIGINSLNYAAAYTPWIYSTYQKEVPFSVIQNNVVDLVTPVPNTLNLSSLTADANLNSLVTTLTNNIADLGVIAATINNNRTDTVTHTAFNSLMDRYNSLRLSVVTSAANPTNLAAAGNLLITFMNDLVNDLPYWKFSFLNSQLITNLNSAATDPIKGLSVYVKKLISIEKNSQFQSEFPLSVFSSTPFDNYENNPGATGWISFTDVTSNTDIPPHPAYIVGDVFSILTDLDDVMTGINNFILKVQSAAATYVSMAQSILYNSHPIISRIVSALQKDLSKIPPSGAVVGVYSSVDGSRGVWKSPANVSLNAVIGPSQIIDDTTQDDLNIDTVAGKSINAIRSFVGKGTLVWGARTLDGNSNEWRYISVRRFFIMVEESVKKATAQFVFEPNDANTWVKVRAMIENYLTVLWRQGALAGAKPEHAFYVKVGLGQTMTAIDVLEGRMIIEIGMAAVRPAEFIILRFSHKMQES